MSTRLSGWTADTRYGQQPIFQIMLQRGITVNQLAIALSVAYGRLQRIVHGATPPCPREVNKLAAEIGATPRELFTDEARYAGGGEL